MTDDDHTKASIDEAAKGLTRAAQNYTTATDFVAAVRMWTHDLTRGQLISVIAQLACQLSNFYDADPLAADAEVREADLRAWLDGRGD